MNDEVAKRAADRLASSLRSPALVSQHWHLAKTVTWRGSLFNGAAGVALLHIVRAQSGDAGWREVHEWMSWCTELGVSASGDCGIYYGAPAVAYSAHVASSARPNLYEAALAKLDSHVTAIVAQRLHSAYRRIEQQVLPRPSEYDLVYGLTGLGAYLLNRDQTSVVLRQILTYLVDLTSPIPQDDDTVPGWWTSRLPSGEMATSWPGGYGDFGMAHGIAGPLALLALAARRGVIVDGQWEAIRTICLWLDKWRQGSAEDAWWPERVGLADLRATTLLSADPLRPSWCYGTPGIARAQYLAGVATSDVKRQQAAAEAIVCALSDPHQMRHVTDGSLCHGLAGIARIIARMAADTGDRRFDDLYGRTMDDLVGQYTAQASHPDHQPGLLEGAAGIGLAIHSALVPDSVDWDAVLLAG